MTFTFMRIDSRVVLAAFVLGSGLSGCSAGGHAAPAGSALVPLSAARGRASGKIQHVVIVIQENRSFDNLFQGYPGADTVPSGLNSQGQTIVLQPVSLATKYDISHAATAFFSACDGTGKLPGTDCKMDGFDQEFHGMGPPNPQYVYVPHIETKPYFDIAREFVLADRMFQSHVDESFVAHQYLIAAGASAAVDLPTGVWGCSGRSDTVMTLTKQRTYGPPEPSCFDHRTLADELDDAGLSWRFYTSKLNGDGGEWSGYQAIRHIRFGPDWKKDVITPQKRFISDVAKGQLANVTWVTPMCVNSDHPNCGSNLGPDWVASLVNAVGQSPFWDSTAMFVVWDDWGGLYDHVPPPHEGFDGLGIRVPLLVASAYAKQRYVSHVQYEFGSILRFAEDQFGLGQLAASDRRANSPEADCFDFTQAPRPFVPIKTKHGSSFFLNQPDDGRWPDDH